MNTIAGPTAACATPPIPKPAVVALLGAFVVNLTGQFASTNLADIQGGIGASADEASWLTTVYTIASFAGVILSPVALRGFGLRRYFIVNAALLAVCAGVGAFAGDLATLLFARSVQGLAAGAFGPMAFAAIFILCKGRQLAWGIAWLAFVLLVSVNAGPTLSAHVEDVLGWRGLYVVQLWTGVALLWVGRMALPKAPFNRDALKSHWPATALLVVATGATALAISQGTRRFWLESPTIAWSISIALGAWIGFAIVQRLGTPRILDTGKLVERAFGLPILLNLIFRASFAATVYLVPLLLAQTQGYRPLQTAQALWWCLLPQVAAFPLAWGLAYRLDGRLPILAGLLLVALGIGLAAQSSSAVAGIQLRASLVLIGIGQMLFLVPTLLAGALPLKPQDGPTATIAFNLTTIGGTTLGTGLLSHLTVERQKLHSNVLVEHVSWLDSAVTDRIAALISVTSSRLADDAANQAAVLQLGALVRREAWLLAVNDAFALLAIVMAGVGVAVAFMNPVPPLSRLTQGVTS